MKLGENFPLLPLKVCPWSSPGSSGRRNRSKVSMSCLPQGVLAAAALGGGGAGASQVQAGASPLLRGHRCPLRGGSWVYLGYDNTPGLGLGRGQGLSV